MTREAGIAPETTGSRNLRLGLVTTPAGMVSAWHHHGDCETGIYMLQGRARVLGVADLSAESTRTARHCRDLTGQVVGDSGAGCGQRTGAGSNRVQRRSQVAGDDFEVAHGAAEAAGAEHNRSADEVRYCAGARCQSALGVAGRLDGVMTGAAVARGDSHDHIGLVKVVDRDTQQIKVAVRAAAEAHVGDVEAVLIGLFERCMANCPTMSGNTTR
jgi:hypothetical protein